jgi:Nitrogen regulatory protein P-II
VRSRHLRAGPLALVVLLATPAINTLWVIVAGVLVRFIRAGTAMLEDVGLIKETVLRRARTGSVGDGKLFVLPVEEAVRLRAGEEVLQTHETQEIHAGA